MTLESCILFWSLINGLDPALTQAVISVESNYNQMALGKVGDSGLMQIRYQYVPETKLQLFNSCTNVMRGTKLLADLKLKLAKDENDLTWINCYNLGTGGCRKLKHPKKWRYYKKIVAKMEQK